MLSVMVIIGGIGIGDPSSNSGQGTLCFTLMFQVNAFRKGTNTSVLTSGLGK